MKFSSIGSRARVVVTLAVAALLTGCGASDPKGTGGAGGTTTALFQKSECGTCVKSSCASAITDCQSDASCAAYLDCLYACPVDSRGNADPTCDAACVTTQGSTESSKKREAVSGCRFYGAGSDCAACSIPKNPVSTSLNQQCTPRPNPPNPCRACFWEHCCDTWDACFDGNNADCSALTDCLQACQTDPLEPCYKTCFDAHPNSVSTFMAQQSCAISQCATDVGSSCDATKRDACTACQHVTCGDPFVQLLSTGPGFLLFSCTEDCAALNKGADCIAGCVTTHPDASDAFFLWAECVTYRCSSSC